MDEVLFFFGADKLNGYLSNWYTAPFKLGYNNTKVLYNFVNVEQAMMASKALLFNDIASFNKILTVVNPKSVKRLGRKVTNFNEQTWDRYKKHIVKECIKAKFTQNPHLLSQLISTGNVYLAEDNPWDKVWGIGTKSENVKAKRTWKGQNLLGVILMELRSELNPNN